MITQTDLSHAHACHLETFSLADDFAQLAKDRLLPPKVWEIALALNTHRSATEIGLHLNMPAEAVLEGLRRLEAAGLVSTSQIHCPWLLTADAPAAVQPPTPVHPATAAAAPASAQAQAAQPAEQVNPAPDVPVEGRSDTAPTQPGTPMQPVTQTNTPRASVRLTMASRTRTQKPAASTGRQPENIAPAAPTLSEKRPGSISLKLAPSRKVAAPAAATSPTQTPAAEDKGRSWAMQPVLDALRLKAGGDPMVGQLLAYRVFLRVPKDLLDSAGIRSVCLIEPDLVIRDLKLKQAIETALSEVTGLAWPKTLAKAA